MFGCESSKIIRYTKALSRTNIFFNAETMSFLAHKDFLFSLAESPSTQRTLATLALACQMGSTAEHVRLCALRVLCVRQHSLRRLLLHADFFLTQRRRVHRERLRRSRWPAGGYIQAIAMYALRSLRPLRESILITKVALTRGFLSHAEI